MKYIKSLPLLFFGAILLPLAGCNAPNGADSDLKPFVIFDKHHGQSFNRDNFRLEEFNATFNISRTKTITQEGGSFKLKNANAVYIYDANGDGYRDICVGKTIDNDIYLDYVYIYDLKNDKNIFYAIDSMPDAANDYHFRMKKDQLLLVKEKCDRSAYATDTYSQGYVKYNAKNEVYIKWDNMYQLESCDVSLTCLDDSAPSLDIKEEGDVKVVTARTNSIYCFETAYKTTNSQITDVYYFGSHVFSLINKNGFDNYLKLFSRQTDVDNQRVYFYFTDKVTADYELQMSGTSIKYRFVVENENNKTLSHLIKGENSLSKINYEENSLDYNNQYDGRRYINEDFKLDSLKSMLDFKVCEVKSAVITYEHTKLYGRITYVFESGYSPYIDVYQGGMGYSPYLDVYKGCYFKYENKWYALVGDFDYKGTSNTYSDQVGFAVGYTELEIKDRLTGNTTTFKDANLIRLEYYVSDDKQMINFNYRYSFVILDKTIYIYDAKTAYTLFSAANGLIRAHQYTITSDYDFSSLLNS